MNPLIVASESGPTWSYRGAKDGVDNVGASRKGVLVVVDVGGVAICQESFQIFSTGACCHLHLLHF